MICVRVETSDQSVPCETNRYRIGTSIVTVSAALNWTEVGKPP